MTKKEIKNLSDQQLLVKIENLSDAVGYQPTQKFINSGYFWTGLFELIKVLVRLFKEKRRRKLNK